MLARLQELAFFSQSKSLKLSQYHHSAEGRKTQKVFQERLVTQKLFF